MKVLHVDLKPNGNDYAEFRYFWDNANQYKPRHLPLAQIASLINLAETNYYTRLPEDYIKTGQALYNWLDGTERYLQQALDDLHRREGIVLAISASESLAHLPWEILHDGTRFLVEATPAIIPIRWVNQSSSQPLIHEDKPANRALNVLFMATSPLEVEPVLDYEAEEGQILAATQRTPIHLQVEESGCLSELAYLVREHEKNYFDVFHLTGHATYNQQPYFLTEDEYGNRVESDTSAIINALKSSVPPLIFLSGCRTGYASNSVVASMAEELLNLGATAVLGWGETVRDTDATAAARRLYWELSQGSTVFDALASTYQVLIQQQARDWHKLRLYVANVLPGALVTPLRAKGRKQLPKPTMSLEFRDDEKRLRVISRENFVGRRRHLQNCLRTLRMDQEKVGILIFGMGGLGKSSIASRLWDRLPDYEKLLWWRQIDEAYLIRKLRDKLIEPSQIDLIPYLDNSQISLKSRLAHLFRRFAELGEKLFLFILDDFEWNLEPREGQYILKSEAAPILEALISAIQETGTEHRVIITCRYRFDSELLNFFHEQGLESFKKAELTKKLSRLECFNSQIIDEDLRERALGLADGNPRLLEFLNDEVLGEQDAETKLTELEQSPEQWKDKIIWKKLYQLIDKKLQQVLSNCLVYEIPVPMAALQVVCDSLPSYKQQLQRGLELGLIEVSSEPQGEDRVYRVSRILPNIISDIQLPLIPDIYKVSAKAADFLYFSLKNENPYGFEPQEKWKEIFVPIDRKDRTNKWEEFFRLFLTNKKIKKRFEDSFFLMYSRQPNLEADTALINQLRRVSSDLDTQNLLKNLKHNLAIQQWHKADFETAWIFYQIMVLKKIRSWKDLLEHFPPDTLKEIDNLWVSYSKGQFGFSIQKDIWQSLGENPDWEIFAKKVGWHDEKDWRLINTIRFNKQENKGNLPMLWTTRTIVQDHRFGNGGWLDRVANGFYMTKRIGQPGWQYMCGAILFDRLKG